MRYSVIIPAAGSGSRMGADVPKVFLKLSEGAEGPSILERTVDIFRRDPQCDRIVVCIAPEWRSRFEEALNGRDKVTLTAGGASRQDSVRNGVEELARLVGPDSVEDTCVLVHDAARCLISQAVITRVVEGVRDFGAVSAAIPVPDTLSRVNEGVVQSFVDRSGVWAIQTPQGFWLGELRGAHFAAHADGFVALDDASVVSRIREVRVVEGDYLNIKVTHPHDMVVARRICGGG